MTIFAKLTVTEDDGIRRFLYPMAVELPFKKSESLEVAVRDEDGNLLPSEAYRSRRKIIIHFAISLEPYEKRKLLIVKSEARAPISDPMKAEPTEEGHTVIRQERLTSKILRSSNLESVVYDKIEHLAGPVTVTLNAEQPDDEPLEHKSTGREIVFQTTVKRFYSANDRLSQTTVQLTACKSWAEIVHTIEQPISGSIISIDIPLTPPGEDEVPTCDFGLGNGVYCKIDGDAVMLEADFYGKKPYCCWQISRLTEGIQRIDYQGDALTPKALSKSLYFHWVLPHRSIAVVITELPVTTTHIQAILGRSGTIHLSVVLGEFPLQRATIGVILHFLNGIPAIAAATNPASIASPPSLTAKS